jgi:hypothetical protein
MSDQRLSNQHSAISNQLTCPHCGSASLLYVEDVSMVYKVREIVNGVLRFEPEGEPSELAVNERLICEDCDRESPLPSGLEVEICED